MADETWISVGSANFHGRPFRLNDGANLSAFGTEFARERIAPSEADRARAREVTLEARREQPLSRRLGNRLRALLRSRPRVQ